jgi:hypothetical protein
LPSKNCNDRWEQLPASVRTDARSPKRLIQEEADADSLALAFRSRFATAVAIFSADFFVVRAGVFFIAANIACFQIP